MSNIDFGESRLYAQPLTKAQQVFREQFVREYVKDYNALAAALRIGLSYPFAIEYAPRILQEPYVQQCLRAAEEEIAQRESENDIAKKRAEVELALRKEAMYHGPDSKHSSRVSALSKLASIYGMEKNNRNDTLLVVNTTATEADKELVARMRERYAKNLIVDPNEPSAN